MKINEILVKLDVLNHDIKLADSLISYMYDDLIDNTKNITSYLKQQRERWIIEKNKLLNLEIYKK
jgi:hypothetical protein